MVQNNKIRKDGDGSALVQDSINFMEQVLDQSFMSTTWLLKENEHLFL